MYIIPAFTTHFMTIYIAAHGSSLNTPKGGGKRSGCAMVLGKLPVPQRPTIWMIEGQGPIALAVGAGGGLFRHFYSPISFFPLSPSV